MAWTRLGRWSVRRFSALIALAAALGCGDDAVSGAPPAQPAPDAGPSPAEVDAGAPSAAVDLAGTWLATIDLPTMPIRLVLNVERGAEGGWTGTLDSPDQGAIGIPITSVTTETITGYHSPE